MKNVDILVTIADIKIFKKIIAGGVENCLVLLRDKSIPLDERWSLFEEVAEFLPIDRYGRDTAWGNEKQISEYDDFSTDRYQTVYLTSRFEMLDEQLVDYAENGETLWYDQAELDAWREQVLQDGRQGFVYDW